MRALTTMVLTFSNIILTLYNILYYTYFDYNNLTYLLYFRIIRKYIRQAQNKLQASSLSKQEKSPNAEKNFSLLEKMMIQGIHSDDIAILLMDMIILGVQAVICNNIIQTKQKYKYM